MLITLIAPGKSFLKVLKVFREQFIAHYRARLKRINLNLKKGQPILLHKIAFIHF